MDPILYTKAGLRSRPSPAEEERREARAVRFLALALAFVAAGCAGRDPVKADRAYQAGLAAVSRIEVDSQRVKPFTVRVTVRGHLPDACTEIDRVRQEQVSGGIEVTVTTRRESGALCATVARPYETSVLLTTHGMMPGLYFVTVNGVRETFQLHEDLSDPNRFEHYHNW
jgi:hypothetical protein